MTALRASLASARTRLSVELTLSALLVALFSCGPALEPSAGPPPVEPAPELAEIVEFSASTGTVALGGQVDLTWEVAGTATVSISSDGDFEVSVSATGVLTSPRLTEATRFTLRAENEAGVARADVRVAVRRPPEPPAIERFEATPEVFSGESVEVGLSWRATGQLSLLAQGEERADFPGQRASYHQVRITEPTVFTLVALGEDGSEIRREARVRRVWEELEPNDRREDAQPVEPGAPVQGTITQGDVDWFRVQVPRGHSIEAGLEPDCGFDSMLELWGPDPERPFEARFLALDHGPGPDGACARIDAATEPAAVELFEGVHFVAVRGFDRSSVGAYRLTVNLIPPSCGNGLVETGRGEQCDPPGEGCGADCTVEELVTHIGPPLDLELDPAVSVEIRLEEEGTIFGRVFGRAFDPNGDCPAGTEIGLFDLDRTGGSTLRTVRESACALPAAPLPAGRYLVKPKGEAPLRLSLSARAKGCGDGFEDRGEQCDEGGPTDGCGSDCRLRVAAVAAPGVPLDLEVPPDSTRYVRVPVAIPGTSIAARVLGTPEGWKLGMYDQAFYFIADVAIGRELSGLGDLHDLRAEDHLIAVTRTGAAAGPTARLEVDVTPPRCGDGVLQRRAGERCDPLLTNAPCDADCQFETSLPTVHGREGPLDDLPLVLPPGPRFLAVETATTGRFEMLLVPAAWEQVRRCLGPRIRLTAFDQAGWPLGLTSQGSCVVGGVDGPAGSYPILVENLDPTDTASLLIRRQFTAARCGDGVVDADEECDGSVGCDPSTCLLQGPIRREQEPNDDFRSAEVLEPLLGERVFGRAPPGDRDMFVFDVGEDIDYGLAFHVNRCSTAGSCQGDLADRFRWFDERGRPLSLPFRDPNFRLTEGRYFFEIPSSNRYPIYRLEVFAR